MPANADREIIDRFKDPEQRESAFNLLVSKYKERLYWHCRRIMINHEDADDAVQNTLVKVWRNLDNFRAESGLYTWLFRIATNESLSLIKERKKHFSGSEGHEYEAWLTDNLITDPYFDGDEAQLKLQKAILLLPEKQRIVFNLKYYEDMKYLEMADVLKTSVGALKASYHLAVKKLEKYILNE
ncbi:MAG: RNA polymerase sigma factor [Bacteroidales bacterium]